MWPFNKNKESDPINKHPQQSNAESTESELLSEETEQLSARLSNGVNGPFDGDTVDIEAFDYSDFANGMVDLGSAKVPLPKNSEVQLEMGEAGPKMLHIVTPFGRITPVAFAAPRSAEQWPEVTDEIAEGMNRDGLTTSIEEGPWGSEVVGLVNDRQIRIIGIDGPRWMLRLTLVTLNHLAEDMWELGREVARRTFVYRGEDPILAGSPLPIVLPPEMVEQVQRAMQQRADAQASNPEQPTDTASE